MSDEIAIISTEQMKSLIYEIRGQKVMLDKDLAKIYGYETKNFNRQVKNNIEKFPDDFMHSLFMPEQSVNTQTEHRKCQYYNDPGHLKCGIGMFSINPERHYQRKQAGQQRDH